MFECLGCGKPFIGTRVGGIPETISSDTYGLLCEPGNVQELAAIILASLNRAWDHEAIVRYSSRFTWETITREIMGVYAQVLRKETIIPVHGDQQE
jgi:glycosyltransferase involved in cell wall biosynthesis